MNAVIAKLSGWILCAALVCVALVARGEIPAASTAPPTHDHGYGQKLGSVEFPVSCSEAARDSMNEGLALLHHMTYEDSGRAFADAAKTDPDCALSYWGQAMAFIHPLWYDPPSAEKFARGAELVQEAQKRGKKTPRERAYIAAVAAYYETGRDGPESKNLVAWDRGWQAVHEQFPDDPEAALFYVLSQIATADPNDKTFSQQARAGELAEKILAQYPNHPGAHHYVIHAYDYPPLAQRALAVARKYASVAPEVPHALHMPSHIFTRLGLWQESISTNERSAAAALAHAEPGIVSNHYLHALDYLAYAHLQRAEDSEAGKVLADLQALKGPYNSQPASPYSLAAVPARLALERQDWKAAAELEPRTPTDFPWDTVPAIEAISQFARALGQAHGGEVAAANQTLARLAVLRDAAAKNSPYWGKQVEIQRLAAQAWTMFAEGDRTTALETMRKAAELEATTEKHPVTPGEALPASELLGDLLMELGQYDAAQVAYKATLERRPGRFNSLYGAGHAAEMRGDRDEARLYYQRLVEQCPKGDVSRERLQKAQEYVDNNRTAVAALTPSP